LLGFSLIRIKKEGAFYDRPRKGEGGPPFHKKIGNFLLICSWPWEFRNREAISLKEGGRRISSFEATKEEIEGGLSSHTGEVLIPAMPKRGSADFPSWRGYRSAIEGSGK